MREPSSGPRLLDDPRFRLQLLIVCISGLGMMGFYAGVLIVEVGHARSGIALVVVSLAVVFHAPLSLTTTWPVPGRQFWRRRL